MHPACCPSIIVQVLKSISGLNMLYIHELDALDSFHPSVLQQDQQYFYDNIDDHKLKPTHVIRQWINTYQPLILKSIKEEIIAYSCTFVASPFIWATVNQ
jgi:hypothetical protein